MISKQTQFDIIRVSVLYKIYHTKYTKDNLDMLITIENHIKSEMEKQEEKCSKMK
jgi:hypothetical protein